METSEIIEILKSLANPENAKGMARFGINPNNTLGLSMPQLRDIAKKVGKNHFIAEELWSAGIHESKILASLVDSPKSVTPEQMERWVLDFDSWDVCDQCVMNLFSKSKYAISKIEEWCDREEEFVRRAGFAMIACYAVHARNVDNTVFIDFFELILNHCTDERNFVKKAVNWALRQIGKRNYQLNEMAIEIGTEILNRYPNDKTARWIANDAIRELVQKREKQAIREKF